MRWFLLLMIAVLVVGVIAIYAEDVVYWSADNSPAIGVDDGTAVACWFLDKRLIRGVRNVRQDRVENGKFLFIPGRAGAGFQRTGFQRAASGGSCANGVCTLRG